MTRRRWLGLNRDWECTHTCTQRGRLTRTLSYQRRIYRAGGAGTNEKHHLLLRSPFPADEKTARLIHKVRLFSSDSAACYRVGNKLAVFRPHLN